MTAIDYEAEYNNRVRVPQSSAIIAQWAHDAAAYRQAHPPGILVYGDGERHAIDVFEQGPGPTLLLIHGGYWQATDRSFYSHLANGLNRLGVTVALPSYDLCPHVSVGEIVQQMRKACRALADAANAPVIVSGHSAGGHLAACILATEACAPSAYAISGVFDLAPLIATNLNGALRLDEVEAREQSPVHWPAPRGKRLDCVVGAAESPEFLRQSRAMADHWGAAGVETRYEEISGANHFTVIAPLADPASSMCARLKAMIDAAR